MIEGVEERRGDICGGRKEGDDEMRIVEVIPKNGGKERMMEGSSRKNDWRDGNIGVNNEVVLDALHVLLKNLLGMSTKKGVRGGSWLGC